MFPNIDPISLEQTHYARDALVTKIVHIGFGAFHRAHQAVYTDLANENEDRPWGIYGINLFRAGALTEQFAAQDNLMVLLEKSSTSMQKRLIRTFTGAMNIQDKGIDAALAKLCEPQVAIVSLTITEKGYCLSPEGQLDTTNKLIINDLANPHHPISAIGIITAALQERKAKNLPAFSVMSCDNIPENGHKTRQAVLDYAALIDSELAKWIESNASFPSTMVDRIVPAMDETGQRELELAVGSRDEFGLISEAFKQWVIEDSFCNGRPQWESVGAVMANNVLPYEEMKLRMLNGSHSFLAYIGALCGYQYIYQCMEDPLLKALTLQLMVNEQATSLSAELDTDLVGYAHTLITRFSNPNIQHQTAQIAMDGSQKLPPRVIDSILTLLQRPPYSDANPPKILLFLLAGWMHFVQQKYRDQETLVDPAADQLNALLSANLDNPCAALLQFKGVFNKPFLSNSTLTEHVTRFYQDIEQHGIRAALESLAFLLRKSK
ncbi:mannitol dehydrogenase family protein [Marinomonas agarivorans]|nr:mannitol dehydrogenase family protein [Marinomonas agarivorans]